jgi:hypothetical protein
VISGALLERLWLPGIAPLIREANAEEPKENPSEKPSLADTAPDKPEPSKATSRESLLSSEASAREEELLFDPGYSFKVDDHTGAGHLRYPLEIAPARAGLTPKLPLQYNSRARNGWLGVGWDRTSGRGCTNASTALSRTCRSDVDAESG